MEASNRCREITWPARSITEDEIVTYCEGVFLEMLLNKLSRLFSQVCSLVIAVYLFVSWLFFM